MKSANDNKTEFEMWRRKQAERQAYVLSRRLDRARFKMARLILEQVFRPVRQPSSCVKKLINHPKGEIMVIIDSP